MADDPRVDPRDLRFGAVRGCPVMMPSAWRRDLPLAGLADACLDAAECRFDPELHDGPDRIESAEERAAREQVAAEVCASCPVLAECLAWALRTRPRRGVWAGLPAAHIAALADLTGDRPGLGEVA